MSRYRPFLFPVLGLVLAGLLAVVLFVGAPRPAASGQAGNADPAPGVSPASANLLDLDVLPTNKLLSSPNFHLVDQHGRPVSLSQFRGKVVVWSLNDDQCTDLCALFAQDIVASEHDLGAAAKDVVFLSVNANPFYPQPADLRAWSVRNDLEGMANWVYVTGTPAQLRATWRAYHVTVELDRKDRTVTHDATVEFIDPDGRLRAIGDFMQGSISTAYYAYTMAQMADDLLPQGHRAHITGTSVGSPSTQGATVGDEAPPFDLPRLGGAKLSSAALRGKPLVLNFWSSTCTLCDQEMPALQQVDSTFRGKVGFVGVDVADPRPRAAAFARQAGARYQLVADSQGQVAAEYRVDALPVTFVIGPHGDILARHEGALTYDELVAVLEMDFSGLPQINV